MKMTLRNQILTNLSEMEEENFNKYCRPNGQILIYLGDIAERMNTTISIIRRLFSNQKNSDVYYIVGNFFTRP